MRYEIESIDKNKVIKNIEFKRFKGNRIIVVTYLDGSVEHFENRKWVYEGLIQIMKEQANKYTENYETNIEKLKQKDKKQTLFSVLSLVPLIVVLGFITNQLIVYLITGLFCVDLALSILAKSLNYKEKINLKKYKLYIDNINIIEEEYKKYVEEQKLLGNNKKTKELEIVDIDKTSYEKLNRQIEEVNRNNEMKNKIKTLTK